MWLFYLLSLCPFFFGLYSYIRFRNIILYEWGLSVLICLFITVIFHVILTCGLPIYIIKFIEILGITTSPKWGYLFLSVILILSQTRFWIWACNNDLNKFSTKRIGTTVYINPLSLKNIKYKSKGK